MNKLVIFVGGGGYVKVLLDCLCLLGKKVYGIVDFVLSEVGLFGIFVFGDDFYLVWVELDVYILVMGVGM